jgi:hypothetical protein
MLAAALALAQAQPAPWVEGWKPLFNGRNLEGWFATPGGQWTWEDGMIVGKSPADERNYGVLLSNAVYHNFRVRGEFQVIKGDSGFYFRVMRVNAPGSVQGVQMEVDNSRETGGLYESNGRGWIAKLDESIHDRTGYVPGQWAKFEVSCSGARIQVSINGIPVVDMADDRNNRPGRFGLQLHAGMEMDVRFKNLEIQVLDEG